MTTAIKAGKVTLCACERLRDYNVCTVKLTKLLLFLFWLLLQGGLEDIVVSIHSKHLWYKTCCLITHVTLMNLTLRTF